MMYLFNTHHEQNVTFNILKAAMYTVLNLCQIFSNKFCIRFQQLTIVLHQHKNVDSPFETCEMKYF